MVVSAKKVVGQQSCSSLAAANSIGKDEREGGSAGVSFQQNWRNLYCLKYKVLPCLQIHKSQKLLHCLEQMLQGA